MIHGRGPRGARRDRSRKGGRSDLPGLDARIQLTTSAEASRATIWKVPVRARARASASTPGHAARARVGHPGLTAGRSTGACPTSRGVGHNFPCAAPDAMREFVAAFVQAPQLYPNRSRRRKVTGRAGSVKRGEEETEKRSRREGCRTQRKHNKARRADTGGRSGGKRRAAPVPKAFEDILRGRKQWRREEGCGT